MTTSELTCAVCNKEPSVGVASVPGVPMSVAYGKSCLEANAHPYEIVVANTAMIGGIEHAAPWWRQLVNDTVTHLAVEPDQFNHDVTRAIREFDEAGL